jgi:hypothetical protein
VNIMSTIHASRVKNFSKHSDSYSKIIPEAICDFHKSMMGRNSSSVFHLLSLRDKKLEMNKVS